MTPGKENFIFFEQLARKQRQLPPQTAGIAFGVPVNREQFRQITAHTNALKEIYKHTVNYDAEIRGEMTLSHFTLFIPWEHDEGRFVGSELKMTYAIKKGTSKAYIAIQISRSSSVADPFISVDV